MRILSIIVLSVLSLVVIYEVKAQNISSYLVEGKGNKVFERLKEQVKEDSLAISYLQSKYIIEGLPDNFFETRTTQDIVKYLESDTTIYCYLKRVYYNKNYLIDNR